MARRHTEGQEKVRRTKSTSSLRPWPHQFSLAESGCTITHQSNVPVPSSHPSANAHIHSQSLTLPWPGNPAYARDKYGHQPFGGGPRTPTLYIHTAKWQRSCRIQANMDSRQCSLESPFTHIHPGTLTFNILECYRSTELKTLFLISCFIWSVMEAPKGQLTVNFSSSLKTRLLLLDIRLRSKEHLYAGEKRGPES